MANDALDEVERLVSESAQRKPRRAAKVKGIEENDEVDMSDDEASEPEDDAPKRRRVKKVDKVEANLSDEEVDRLLPSEESIPAPEENVKSLDDMYAKYGIGNRPEFKLQVWRLWPKMAPGGTKFDGYYETWQQPLTLDEVQREYGGGTYRLTVQGPHPTSANLTKRYASYVVELPGEPKYSRKPRAAAGAAPPGEEAGQAPPPLMMPSQQENAKLSEQAMKLAFDVSERERDERRRAEEKAESRAREERQALMPLVDAERRVAEMSIQAVKERAESERRSLEERLHEERREREEMKRQMEDHMRGRPSVTQELAELARSGLLGKEDTTAKEMVRDILERHQRELALIHEQHAKFVESLRGAHATEVAAVREAQRRELEAEREAGRSREQRVEDRLAAEREERRRDQERHREVLEERDRAWKDRLEQALLSKDQSWESRHQSTIATYESRSQWMQTEIDRLKVELQDAKHKIHDTTDPVAQVMRMRDLQTTLKDALGISDAPAAAPSSGGITIGGGADDWKQTLIEGALERLPQIASLLGGGAAPQQAAQAQQQYYPGQVVDTPNGQMVVVVDPASGQLALAPKAAVEAHERALRQQKSPLLEGEPRRKRPASRAARPPAAAPPRKQVSVTPNLAEGLPKRAAPWEGGGDIDEDVAAPPPVPRMRTRKPEMPDVTAEGPVELSSTERSVLRMLAKEVHEHVVRADDPDDLVQKLMSSYPAPVLNQAVGQYTVEQIARGIVQVMPDSAGSTPAGQRFVLEAFTKLQRALSEA